MKLTNNGNLPEAILRALKKTQERYDAGPVDTSVTQLITPARINLLRKLHYKDMEKDLSEEFWALLGSGVHHLLELGATEDMIVEERLYMNIDGWRISGQLDCQEEINGKINITDYKVTSVYSVSGSTPKLEWEQQLNLQAMLVEANKDKRIGTLHICAVLRDWSSSDAKRDLTYPQAPMVMVPIPLWSKVKQLEYVRERIAAHRQAAFDHEMGERIEECTDEDRWVRNSKYAVIKEGGKRALKTFNNIDDALALVEEKGGGYDVVYRPGKSTRCGFCGVSQWCDQYTRILKDEANDDPQLP